MNKTELGKVETHGSFWYSEHKNYNPLEGTGKEQFFEYKSRDYANVSFFEHDLIGSESASGTGSNGPCAGCHMRTAAWHTFMPLERGHQGLITEITANEQTCGKCHTGNWHAQRLPYWIGFDGSSAPLDTQRIYVF